MKTGDIIKATNPYMTYIALDSTHVVPRGPGRWRPARKMFAFEVYEIEEGDGEVIGHLDDMPEGEIAITRFGDANSPETLFLLPQEEI